jgi:hypothetical protein
MVVVAGVLGWSGVVFGQEEGNRKIGQLKVELGDRPTTRPVGKPVEKEQMRKMFLELDHPDGRVRERAREKLMGIRRTDLGVLAEVMAEFRPLEQQTVRLMKEIVTHVYLTEDEYDREARGFLGISMPRQGEIEERMQVIVESRMPGFGGFAALRDGDVILDIVESPQPQPLSRDNFIDAIKAMRPERTVKLKVLRQGVMRVVEVRVSPRPAERDRNGFAYETRVQELVHRRSEEAEKFWNDTFGRVVEGEEKTVTTGPVN